MPILRRLILLVALIISPYSMADTRDNALALFSFAESTYPELLSPAAPELQEIQGAYVRYYSDTKIYLGVFGDNVLATGGVLGSEVGSYGKLSELISVLDSDISDTLLSNRRAQCSYYAENRFSSVLDIKRNILFAGSVQITVEGSECVITTNSIPNHDFNDSSAAFATNVSAVSAEFRIPTAPAFAPSTTAITLTTDNAVLLNGVKVDLLAAGCFGVGDGKIGCNDINQAWRYDPMSPEAEFGTDQHNAHTQPDGTYHYHGNPQALFDQNPNSASPVIGFAADGFPIFGTFFDDGEQIRATKSSFQLKSGSRPTGSGNPGGSYDGEFRDDCEYVQGSGDLDECNGMMRSGVYGYYVVNEHPWILACYKGTVNTSFNKSGGGGPPGGPP